MLSRQPLSRLVETMVVILCLGTQLKSYAQKCDTLGFQTIYYVKGLQDMGIIKAVTDQQGNIYQGINTVPNYYYDMPRSDLDVVIMKTNKRGTPLWANSFGGNRNEQLNDMAVMPDGGVVVVGYTQAYDEGEGWAFKVGPDGRALWSLGMGRAFSSFSRVLPLRDGGMAIVGRIAPSYRTDDMGNVIADVFRGIVLVLESNGKTRWYKEFYLGLEHEDTGGGDILQLQDGSLLLIGGTNNRDTASYYDFLLKLDVNTGQPSTQLKSKFPFYHAKERSNGSIRLYADNGMMELDRDLDFKWAKQWDFDRAFNYLTPVPMPSDSVDYFTATIPGTSWRPFLFTLVDTSRIGMAYSYQRINPLGNINFNSCSYQHNQFLIYGGYTTSNFTTGHNITEYQGYLIQTDPSGATPCATPEQVQVTLTNVYDANISTTAFHFDDRAPLKDAFLGNRFQLMPQYLRDCYETRCCVDTVVQRETSLCSGSTYTLANGTVVDTAGVFSTVFNRPAGCDSIVYDIVKLRKPLGAVSLGGDTCLADGRPITFSLPYAPSQVNYEWQDGSTDSFYVAKAPGLYWVKVQDSCSMVSDSVKVLATCSLPVFVPNAFTPNADGRNDLFRIVDLKGQSLRRFSIYNRYGREVFRTADPRKGWDGTRNGQLQPAGTYIYLIQYKDLKGDLREMKGWFVLIR